jgi:energy-coupling factor transporter ATP-binding protein EcfA2
MKSCRFLELSLLSEREATARRVRFDPTMTVIVGPNDSGKSALVKSLYYALGAEPKQEASWRRARVVSACRFVVDEAEFTIVRDQNVFGVFDASDEMVGAFESVTNELAPFLSDLFDFKLRLRDQQNEHTPATPAFLYLPYYVDQDLGWTDTWSSFVRLGQFRDWRKDVAEYHAGVRTNDWYDTRHRIDQIKRSNADLAREADVLRAALKTVRDKLTTQAFDLDLAAFGEDLDRLIAEAQRINEREQKHKARLVALREQEAVLRKQAELAEAAIRELAADFRFATNTMADPIDCPTCGASYENSFVEQFDIARDEDRLREFSLHIERELYNLQTKLSATEEVWQHDIAEQQHIHELLGVTRGTISLRDVLDSESRKIVDREMATHLESYLLSIGRGEEELRKLEQHLLGLDDRDRRVRVYRLFAETLSRFRRALDVVALPDDSTTKVLYARPTEQGSHLKRALVAFYFALWKLISSEARTSVLPIVIDSPLEGAQDVSNEKKILEFVFSEQPRGIQMIVAVEELHGISPGRGSVLVLEEKRKLLANDEYETIHGELEPKLRAVYARLTERKTGQASFGF